MARFSVLVKYTMQRKINVYASDESEAEEKACDVVLGWKDVDDAEAVKGETEEE